MSSSGPRLRLDQLLPLVYDQLRVYASHALEGERAGMTLQTTDLVHEVYLRLSRLEEIRWDDDQQIMRAAVGVMRRILVDHARARKASKRTPPGVRTGVPPDSMVDGASHPPTPDLLDLDSALRRLAEIDPRKSEIVELRYFGGFQVEEVAGMLGISAPTVKRDWALARAWLFRELGHEPDAGP